MTDIICLYLSNFYHFSRYQWSLVEAKNPIRTSYGLESIRTCEPTFRSRSFRVLWLGFVCCHALQAATFGVCRSRSRVVQGSTVCPVSVACRLLPAAVTPNRPIPCVPSRVGPVVTSAFCRRTSRARPHPDRVSAVCASCARLPAHTLTMLPSTLAGFREI